MRSRGMVTKLCLFLLIVGVLLAPAVPAGAQSPSIIYVRSGASGANDGSSWADAYTDLQAALAAANPAPGETVEIWVAAGTYSPGTEFFDTYTLKSGVVIYGGFPNTGSPAMSDRDPALNVTTLDGEAVYNHANRAVVTAPADTDHTAVLDGFTITKGYASGSTETGDDNGGGLLVLGSPTLTNLVVTDNRAFKSGGGMYIGGGSPTLTNVVFSGNDAMKYGGGLAIRGGSPTLVGVIFRDNVASTSAGGGGMHVLGGTATLVGAAFSGNSAVAFGGGLRLTSVVPSGDFDQGTAFPGTSLTLTNVVFADNSYGGMRVSGSGEASASTTLTNVVFTGNSGEGGLYVEANGNATVTNSIFWGNRISSSPGQLHVAPGGNLAVSYSDVEGGCAAVSGAVCGEGNIEAFPFVNSGDVGVADDIDWDGLDDIVGTADDGLRLKIGSPAVDAGTNIPFETGGVANGVSTDLAGDLRIRDGNGDFASVVDMGAFESLPPVSSGRIYVRADAQGANDGTDWQNAFTDLQAALLVADSGAEVWVAQGTYKPTTGTNRDGTFWLESGIAIYGGFAGTEDALEQRDPAAHETILSGDLKGDDGADFANNTGNAYHVVSVRAGADETTVLDGFTITGGNANGLAPFYMGAGIYNSGGGPTLTRLRLSGNAAAHGAGMYTEGGDPKLIDVTFAGNRATNSGGGILVQSGSPTLTNVTFDGNAADYGGGLSVPNPDTAEPYAGTLSLSGVTFSANTAQFGGGLGAMSGDIDQRDVVFDSNQALLYGGGMHVGAPGYLLPYVGDLTVTGAVFRGNRAGYSASCTGYEAGGGMYILGASPTLTNAVFSGNYACTDGGGVWTYDGSPQLINVTFAGNTASTGGAVFADEGAAAITNGILWADSGGEIVGSVDVSYSIVQGGYDGTGNLSDDPLFVDAAGGDLHLQATSPGLDAGSDEAVPSGVTTDLDGNPRIQGSAVDMGAYEYEYSAPVVTQHPDDQDVVEGESATFTAAATGSPAPTVRWEVSTSGGASWTEFGMADETTLVVGPVSLVQNGWQFRAVFTNSGGSATTDGATLTVTARPPAIVYVDDSATGAGDGTSWTDAYTDLQSALAAAQAGDHVWVAAGTYKPITGTDRDATFSLKDGVSVYGGFAGSETSLDERNWRTNVTTLSGDIGTPGNVADNVYHVVTIGTGITSFAVLDGFTITGGNANGGAFRSQGGGIYYDRLDVSPATPGPVTLRNLIVTGNRATQGGGAYFYSYPQDAPASLTDCAFIGNQALSSSSTARGGAIRAGAPLTLTNVVLSGNYVGPTDGWWHRGSAIDVNYHPLTLNNVTVSGNHVQNSNPSYGGVVFAENNASVTLNNTVLWGNTIAGGGAETRPLLGSYTAQVHYSDVQNGDYERSDGNIEADPLFVSPASAATGPTVAGDFRLGEGSPAIGAGSDALVTTTTDLDGSPRIQGAAVDMGAYEAEAASTPPVVTAHPTDQSVVEGESATFTAMATGSPEPTVRWQVSTSGGASWAEFGEAVETTLVLGSVSLAQNGWQFRAVFTNSEGSATTDGATLTVTPANVAPVINSVTNNGPVDEGSNATVSVEASDEDGDTLAYSFDCDSDGTFEIGPQGAASASCTFGDNGAFVVSVKVSDGEGGEDTASSTVNVNNVAPAPDAGDDVTLRVGESFQRTVTFTDPGDDTWMATADYGDGTPQAIVPPAQRSFAIEHQYSAVGTYIVTVTVADDDGDFGEDTVTVVVANTAPAVNAGTDATIDEGSTFSRSGSFTDPDADAWTATVDYGDGGGEETLALEADKTFGLSHAYADNGTYTVTVTVGDGTATGSDTLLVTVNNVAPVVNAGDDAAIDADDTFSGSGSFTDPGDDSWVATVDYGDGTGSQALSLNPDKTFGLSHLYAIAGTYTVTVTVTDDDAGSGFDNVVVSVSAAINALPVIESVVNDGPVDEGSAVTVTVTATDTDSDTLSYSFDCDNDGTYEVGPQSETSGSCTFGDNGSYTVGVQVDDGNTGMVADSTLVTVDNVSPVVDAGGDAAIVAGDTFSRAGSFTDPGADEWTATVDWGEGNGPEHLALASKAFDLSHVYLTAGEYEAVVTVTDDDGGTGSDTVTVRVSEALAQPAITSGPVDVTVEEGQTATFTASATGNPAPSVQWQRLSDEDGATWADIDGATSTTLSFAAELDDDGSQYRAVFTNSKGTAMTEAATLTVTEALSAPQVTIDPSSRTTTGGETVAFTATATGNPEPTVQWEVSTDAGKAWTDVEGATDTTLTLTAVTPAMDGNQYRARFTNSEGSVTTGVATLTVTTVNTAPEVSAGDDTSVDEGSAFAQPGSFTDTDTDAWTATVDYGDGTGSQALTLTPDKTFSLSHTYADNGTYTVMVTVSDGVAQGMDTLEVTVNNVAPAVDAGPDSSIHAGATFSSTGSFTDAGADVWAATVDYGDGSGTQELSLSGQDFSLSHPYPAAGEYTVTVTVVDDDGGSGSDTATVEVTVVILLPSVLANPTDQSAAVGQTVTFSATAEGSPAPTVQWQVSTSGGRNWKSIQEARSETYSFVAHISQDGNYYRAVFTNPAGTATTNAAVLRVARALAAPVVIVQPADQAVTLGGTASFTATASGGPPPSVQWQVSADGGANWTDVSGATSNTLTLSDVRTEMNGYRYRAVFSNEAGSATSYAAVLTVTEVLEAPALVVQPQSQAVQEGQTVTFTASASGSPSPSVQWQVSTDGGAAWGDLAGAVSNTCSFVAYTSQDGNHYRAVFTSSVGTAVSDGAALTVTGVAADLGIEKSGEYDPSSNTITWTLTVTNLGPGAAEGVVVTDNLAKGTKAVSVTYPDHKVTGPLVRVAVGTLGAGQSASFDIVVQLNPRTAPPVENTATVTSSTSDPNPANNTVNGLVY